MSLWEALQTFFVAYPRMFSHSRRCSHAFLTSMSFSRAKVPTVRWSFAGFWKMLSSTPWSYKLMTPTNQCWIYHEKCWSFGWLASLCNDMSYLKKRSGLHFDGTFEHCSNTSSLNFKNPSWILGWFKGNDRKCVKGCFLRKLSTRTSTRVTADDTAALWKPVITDHGRWENSVDVGRPFSPVLCLRDSHQSVLPLLALGCWWMSWCQTPGACVSLLFYQWCTCRAGENTEEHNGSIWKQKGLLHTIFKLIIRGRTCKEHLGRQWHSGILFLSVQLRESHRFHLPQTLHSLNKEYHH